MSFGFGFGFPKNYVAATLAPFTPAALFTGSTTGAWYDPSDMTTLFLDAAGTTPVTAVEQPVGLMLDKRDTAYSTYFDGAGDYISTPDSTALNLSSGDFTIECWIYPQRSSIELLNKGGVVGTYYPDYAISYNGTGKIDFGIGGSLTAWQSYSGISLVPQNAWTHVAIVRSGNSIKSYINGVIDINAAYTKTAVNSSRDLNIGLQITAPSAQNWLGNISNLRIVKGTALYTANFTPPTGPLTAVAGTSLLTCGTSWSGNPAITTVGNTRADKLNPFTTGTGNHAFNPSGNSANFPVLSARYNLLTKTEQFDDATVWERSSGNGGSVPVVTADYEAGPFAGTLADQVQLVRTTQTGSFSQLSVVMTPLLTVGVTYIASVWMKSRSGSVVVDMGSFNGAYGKYKPTVTTDWQRFSCQWTVTNPTSRFGPLLYETTGTSQNADLLIWGADLRVANDALNQPAYQRVNTATDYDTVGFKPYLRFNGVNQWLQTNSIDFSYGDKMFVSAGVRKLSATTSASMILELSSAYDANNGSFSLYDFSDAKTYVGSKGTAAYVTVGSTTHAAPYTSILSLVSSISTDELKIRVNGTQEGSSTADQGTGNYQTYPLYIGARAGTSLWFNGRLYQMVVAGKQASVAEITSTETYINQKTGAY